MRHRVLACDYDGTLATEGVCSDQTVEALRARRGRRHPARPGDRPDPGGARGRLRSRHPLRGDRRRERRRRDRRHDREGGAARRLELPSQARRRVRAHRGHAAGRRPGALLDRLEPAAQALGRDRQGGRRPPGGSQSRVGDGPAAGYQQAHRDSRRRCELSGNRRPRTVAVGDGENDIALFAVAGVSVAVANAVDVLKARADVVLTEPNGKGIQSLAAAIVAGDLGVLTALSPLAG